MRTSSNRGWGERHEIAGMARYLENQRQVSEVTTKQGRRIGEGYSRKPVAVQLCSDILHDRFRGEKRRVSGRFTKRCSRREYSFCAASALRLWHSRAPTRSFAHEGIWLRAFQCCVRIGSGVSDLPCSGSLAVPGPPRAASRHLPRAHLLTTANATTVGASPLDQRECV